MADLSLFYLTGTKMEGSIIFTEELGDGYQRGGIGSLLA